MGQMYNKGGGYLSGRGFGRKKVNTAYHEDRRGKEKTSEVGERATVIFYPDLGT